MHVLDEGYKDIFPLTIVIYEFNFNFFIVEIEYPFWIRKMVVFRVFSKKIDGSTLAKMHLRTGHISLINEVSCWRTEIYLIFF